jgi:hypothetical protein
MREDSSSLCSFVGEEIAIKTWSYEEKWSDFVKGKDGFLYGIPCRDRRVLKFNPVDKSMEMIGPDFGENDSWCGGVLAKNGRIYCPPNSCHNMLRIDTIAGTVETIDLDLQLQLPRNGRWRSGAIGRDECIYYLPSSPHTKDILRLDPDTDNLSVIRVPLSCRSGYSATVLGKDGCIYGIPKSFEDCVIRFDPMEPENISYFDKYIRTDSDNDNFGFEFVTGGVLGCDGNIYALEFGGKVLKIDTSARTVSGIDQENHEPCCGGPVVGSDQCIYWYQPQHF